MIRVLHLFFFVVLLGGLCALAACDSSDTPSVVGEDRPKIFVEALAKDLQHRALVGYGGRQFEIVFESDEARYERDGEGRWIVSIPHWQEQKKASMKYTLAVHIKKTDAGWELTEATNLYHGTRDADGYENEPGYKPVGVLMNTKGNVYAKPIRRAFQASFE